MLEFTYAQVVSVLAKLNRVPEKNMGAFRARLRNLQSKSFPPGTNTGKGRAATYTSENLLQMAVATELMQVGFRPDRIVKIVTSNWTEIRLGFLMALTTDDALDRWTPPLLTNDYVLALAPEGLRELSDVGEREYDYHESVEVFPFETIVTEMPLLDATPSVGESHRKVILRLRPIGHIVLHYLDGLFSIEPMGFYNDLAKHGVAAGEKLKRILAEFDDDLAALKRGS